MKIRIMHIITRLDTGGSAQNTLQSCRGLNPEQYEIILVHGPALESRMTDRERRLVEQEISAASDAGVKIIILPELHRNIRPLSDLICLLKIYRLLKTFRPFILHTHTSKAGILGRWAAIAAGIPRIVHTPHGHVFYGHFSPLMSEIFRILEKVSSLFTHALIALTEGEKKDYIRLRVCPARKIFTIHSGVDISRFMQVSERGEKIKEELGIPPEYQVVCTAGWLLPIKGPMVLLQAMCRVWESRPQTVLLYVGKGEMREELEAEACRKGVQDKVIFAGWREDVHDIMPLADVFVLPSLNEGMGRVLVEAMAAGKALVASRTGGIPDLVRHRENGLLVPPGDEAALAGAIEYLLSHPEQARKMGERGRKICLAFTQETMIKKLEALYESLIGRLVG